jgi:hypothetical protein
MLKVMKKQSGLGQYGKDRFRQILVQDNKRLEQRLSILLLNKYESK